MQLTKKNTWPQRDTKFSTPTTVFSLDHRAMANIAIKITMGPAQNLQVKYCIHVWVVVCAFSNKTFFGTKIFSIQSTYGIKLNIKIGNSYKSIKIVFTNYKQIDIFSS